MANTERAVNLSAQAIGVVGKDPFANDLQLENIRKDTGTKFIRTGSVVLQSTLGISSFSLNSANFSTAAVNVGAHSGGSVQISWSGATSSNAFATPGTIKAEISNNGTTWYTLFTVSIDAASGDVFERGIADDFNYIRLTWTKNTSTGGTANASAVFK